MDVTTAVPSPFIGALVDAVRNSTSEHADQQLTNITVGEATVIALVVVCTILLLLLNLCCQQCKRNEKTIDDLQASRLMPAEVVAQEIRPGLVVVQGSPSEEETQRIIQQYDAMKAAGKSDGSMFSYNYRENPPAYGQLYGAAGPVGGVAPLGGVGGADAPMVGISSPPAPIALMPHDPAAVARMTAPRPGDGRPPAYAPGHTQYGSLYPSLR